MEDGHTQMNAKKETCATYDKYARDYEEKAKDYIEKYIQNDFNLFLQKLRGKKILDLGGGPGRDSIRFKQRGFHPICIDISKAMVKLCKNKGIEAYEMDIEKLDFENNTFDGVWAYTSLLHIPKNQIKQVLKKIRAILKSKGVFYIGMKAGNFEGFQESKSYPNHKRYFALYTKDELEKLLSEFFEILSFSKVEIDGEHIYINFLCKNNT